MPHYNILTLEAVLHPEIQRMMMCRDLGPAKVRPFCSSLVLLSLVVLLENILFNAVVPLSLQENLNRNGVR